MRTLFPQIRKMVEADLDPLVKLANFDGHIVIAPTHIVEKDHQIIGYVSLGVLPTVLVWMDQHRAMVRDSMAVANFFETRVADAGASHVVLPCTENSPYRPYLESVGYVSLGATAFIKPLK